MDFIPFTKWLERNPDIEPDVECENCSGSGRQVCDCEHCRGHKCSECRGTGRVVNPAARKIYNTECQKARTILQAA